MCSFVFLDHFEIVLPLYLNTFAVNLLTAAGSIYPIFYYFYNKQIRDSIRKFLMLIFPELVRENSVSTVITSQISKKF